MKHGCYTKPNNTKNNEEKKFTDIKRVLSPAHPHRFRAKTFQKGTNMQASTSIRASELMIFREEKGEIML